MNCALIPAPMKSKTNVTMVNTGQNWDVSSLIWVSHTRLTRSIPYSKCPPGETPPLPDANAPRVTDVGLHAMAPPIRLSASTSTAHAYSAMATKSKVSSWPTTCESSSLAALDRTLCLWYMLDIVYARSMKSLRPRSPRRSSSIFSRSSTSPEDVDSYLPECERVSNFWRLRLPSSALLNEAPCSSSSSASSSNCTAMPMRPRSASVMDSERSCGLGPPIASSVGSLPKGELMAERG
mmetsp:Transcript_8003/g.32371  ORF Transcript_8003/g.32371 Transcript_8003/m.32371 type:complete len:237 (-) Transcript_8003:186-896(-)